MVNFCFNEIQLVIWLQASEEAHRKNGTWHLRRQSVQKATKQFSLENCDIVGAIFLSPGNAL